MKSATLNPPTVPIDKRNIFLGLSTFQIFAMFRRGLFYNYLSIYLRSFCKLSVTETTFFATFPMIINIIFQTFIWGPYSDKHQIRKSFIISGELCAAVGVVVVWYIHKLTANVSTAGYIIIIGLTIVEIFWSMSNIGWTSYISDVYSERERTGIQGILSSIGGIGRIIGVWAGGLLYNGLTRCYDGWGFRDGLLFFIEAIVMIVSIVPFLFLPEGGIRTHENKSSLHSTISTENNEKNAPTQKLYILFLLALCFVNFGRNSISVTSSQYLILESGFHVSTHMLGYIASMFSFAMIIMGFIMKRVGAKGHNGFILLVGTSCAIFSCIVLGSARHVWLIFVSQFFAGMAEVMIFSASYTIASILIPPKKRSQLFGLFNATFFLSWGIAGTCIAGPLIDILLSHGATELFAYTMSFHVGGLITCIGLIVTAWLCFWYIPRKKHLTSL